MNLPKIITGPWNLRDFKIGKLGEPHHGLKVFSCFHCGGGSTMGYKLAGFEVLGGVEIDPEMMNVYKKNHRPQHSYLMSVEDFNKIPNKDLPPELFKLDILDGSPPCSSFSMAGSREDAWGEKKKFREGQTDQVLDDLFFHFIDIAAKLKPRMVIAENVKGLIQGVARGYVKEIFSKFRSIGYDVQLFLLNSARMGVPQARERTFFIARRKELALTPLHPNFSEKIVTVREAFLGTTSQDAKTMNDKTKHWWSKTKPGALFSVCGADTGKFNCKLHPSMPAWTQTATPNLYHWKEARGLSPEESVRVQSFPDDYDFVSTDPRYVCGMSVPPLMMQRVALECAKVLLG